jgi:hypothetical protein
MFVHRTLLAALSLAFAFGLAAGPHAALAQTPNATASAAPSASAAPVKHVVGAQRETFVVGDYLVSPTIYNEATAGHSGRPSYALEAATEFYVQNMPFMVVGYLDDWSFSHPAGPPGNCAFVTGCITNIGHTGQTYRPGENLHDDNEGGGIGYRIAWPRIYAVIAYTGHSETLNYPTSNGVGLGFEKLPDFERLFTVYGYGYYFPDLESKFTVFNRVTGVSTVYTLTYHELRYRGGVMISPFTNHQAFIDIGAMGDGLKAGHAAPGSQTHLAGYIGAGLFTP